MRWAVAALLALCAGAATGQTGCLRPVEGAQSGAAGQVWAESCVAKAQYRTIAGYSKLVVQSDLCGVGTIDGGRLRSLGDDGVQTPYWASARYYQAQGGTVYAHPLYHSHRLYRLRPGDEQFSALNIPGLKDAAFDPHGDVLLVRARQQPLQEWSEAEGLQPSPLAGLTYEADDVLPAYFSALDGYLSVSEGRLYWSAADVVRWEPVRLGWFDRHRPPDIWNISPERSYLDEGVGLFVLQFSDRVLVFDISAGQAPEFLYVVEGVKDVFQASEGPVIAVHAPRGLVVEDQGRVIYRIMRSGPTEVTARDVLPAPSAPDDLFAVIHNGRGLDGWMRAPVFRFGQSFAIFDGTDFVDASALGLDPEGLGGRWARWHGRWFLLDERGWSEVTRDLTLIPSDVPVTALADVAVSDGLSAVFIAGRDATGAAGGDLWASRDGLDFVRVDTGAVEVIRYLADLPDAAEGLVLAQDGLYLLDETCLSGGR